MPAGWFFLHLFVTVLKCFVYFLPHFKLFEESQFTDQIWSMAELLDISIRLPARKKALGSINEFFG